MGRLLLVAWDLPKTELCRTMSRVAPLAGCAMLCVMSGGLQPRYPYWLPAQPLPPNHDLEVGDKYSGEVATRVAMADPAAIDAAIAAAVEAAEPMGRPPSHER